MNSRLKLIQSTRELLWERGYVATSPKAIQERSGLGQGSMYHHFTGKAELALESIRTNADDMKRIVAERLTQGTTAMEKLQALLLRPRNVQRGCRIGGLTQDPDIVANKAMRQVLGEAFATLHAVLVDLIRTGQKNGEFDPELDADDIAAAIAAVLQGGYVLARASASEQPFYRAIHGLLSLLGKQKKQ